MEKKTSFSKEHKKPSLNQNFFIKKYKQITWKRKYTFIATLVFIFLIISTIFLTTKLIRESNNFLEYDFTLNNVTMSSYEAAINYILSGHNKDGGFSPIPFRQFYQIFGATKMASDIFSTYYAVSTLFLLNELSKLDTNSIINYIEGYLYDSSHGEEGENEHGPSDLWLTFSLLEKLNATDIVYIEDFISWTLDDFLPDGSFRPFDNVPASIPAVKSAYLLLSEFESLDSINWTLSTQYVLSQYLGNGFFQDPLLPDSLNIISTLDAYTYLSYTNQLETINVSTIQELIPYLTKMYLMVYDEYNLYEGFSHRVRSIHGFIQFAWENNLSLSEISPETLELCIDIKNSQDEVYGGFPTFWDNYTTFVWVDDTVFALETFYECDLLNLMNDNITVVQPPNSPYICKINSTYILLILSLTFAMLVYLFKKKVKSNSSQHK